MRPSSVNYWQSYGLKHASMYFTCQVQWPTGASEIVHLTKIVKQAARPNVETDVLPVLRKQNGFKDEITFLAGDRAEAVAISLWDRKENADNYSRDTYPEVLKTLAKVVEGTPKVENYEVANSTFHKIAARK